MLFQNFYGSRGSDDERLAEIRFNKDRSDLTNLEKYSTIWTDNADKQEELGYENNDLQKLGRFMGFNGEAGLV